jgi:predicted metal-binding protein
MHSHDRLCLSCGRVTHGCNLVRVQLACGGCLGRFQPKLAVTAMHLPALWLSTCKFLQSGAVSYLCAYTYSGKAGLQNLLLCAHIHIHLSHLSMCILSM